MKLDVIDKKENQFLKRTDVILTIDHKGQPTPKTEDIEKSIAEEFKSVPEKVEIIYIFSEAGLAKSKVKARVWKEKMIEKKKKIVPKEVEEKPAEAKVEVKKEEAKPKEEQKAEKPKEEKKPEGEKK